MDLAAGSHAKTWNSGEKPPMVSPCFVPHIFPYQRPGTGLIETGGDCLTKLMPFWELDVGDLGNLDNRVIVMNRGIYLFSSHQRDHFRCFQSPRNPHLRVLWLSSPASTCVIIHRCKVRNPTSIPSRRLTSNSAIMIKNLP